MLTFFIVVLLILSIEETIRIKITHDCKCADKG